MLVDNDENCYECNNDSNANITNARNQFELEMRLFIYLLFTNKEGRRHGFESAWGQILRVKRAGNFFTPSHFLASWGTKLLR